jgi:HPt (histidine-containing phosphotransfer) domain-containing protein
MTNVQVDIVNMKTIAEAKALMNDRFPMMVKYFLEDIQMYLEEIEKAVQVKNVEMAIAPAHTIKSSAKQLGVDRVCIIAKDIEELCRNILENGGVGFAEFEALYSQLKKEVDIATPELNKLC